MPRDVGQRLNGPTLGRHPAPVNFLFNLSTAIVRNGRTAQDAAAAASLKVIESCLFMTIDTPEAESGSEESHVDRAMLGPTPDNPSVSLEKRLKRARFFDQRERQVAAGEAEPVDADAGLPEQLVDDIESLERD